MLQRAEFTTTDVDTVAAMLGAAYGTRLSVGRADHEPFGFDQRMAFDDTVSVANFSLSGQVTAAADGFRDAMFVDIIDGPYSWQSRDRSGDQSSPFIVPARQELSVAFGTVRSVIITVDENAMTRWFAHYGGFPRSPALLHRATIGSEAVRRAVRFYGEVMPTDAFESELVRSNLLDVLFSMTAHHLIGDASTASTPAAPAALRRAEEYLRAHAAEPVSVADAASAALLSVRGLQDQFRRWLGLTPAQYLRNVRLEAIRAELVAARRDGLPVRVAEVAQRWGFAHAGRFAGYYLDAFGELPSHTLRNGSIVAT